MALASDALRSLARGKQVSLAESEFAALPPSARTTRHYAAMCHAYANAGQVGDALRVADDMLEKHCGGGSFVQKGGRRVPQNMQYAYLVVATSLIKAASKARDYETATDVYATLTARGVKPDARLAANVLRAALWANVATDDVCEVLARSNAHLSLAGRRLLAGMFLRANRTHELKLLCRLALAELKLEADYRSSVDGGLEGIARRANAKLRTEHARHVAALAVHAPAPAGPGGDCLFYARGFCERGACCPFRHNPAAGKRQRDRSAAVLEQRFTAYEMHAKLAMALTLLGRRAPAKRALARCDKLAAALGAGDAQNAAATPSGADNDDDAEDDAGGSLTSAAFRETKREELALEVARVRRAWEHTAKPHLRKLGAYADAAMRTMLFDGVPAGATRKDTAAALVRAWRRGFGLDAVSRDGRLTDETLRGAYRNRLTKHGRVAWSSVFACDNPEVHLEVACGSGEWAAAQARADRSACWACLEIRPDRVHRCFAHAALERLPNLAVLAGDAREVLADRVRKGSVRRIVVRFPEPPHRRDHAGATDEAAVLNDSFFAACCRALRDDGMLSLYGDNRPYLDTLARDLHSSGAWAEGPGAPPAPGPSFAVRDGEPPGEASAGADGASLFDRFWAKGGVVGRWHVLLRRAQSDCARRTKRARLL